MEQILQANQKQQLSACQLQSLALLSMDTNDLSCFIQQEYMENPTMEMMPPSPEAPLKILGNYFDKTDYKISDGIIHDEKPEPFVSNNLSLQEYLIMQLSSSTLYTNTEWRLFKFIINSLDDSGFLSMEPLEISLSFHVPINHVINCISTLQSLDPAGVCALNTTDSLLIQAKRLGYTDIIFESLIKNYIPDIANGKLNKISKELKITRKQLSHYISLLKTLNPKPCSHFGNAEPQFIIPDIIFSYENTNWTITINDNWNGSIGISKLYQQYYKNVANAETAEYIEKKIKRARFIMSCIEQRRSTLTRLSQYIIKKQQFFLLKKEPLNKMSAKSAAKELGLHPSTISRAIHNKYVQTPIGTFPIKLFFEKGMPQTGTQEKEVSSSSIKELLKSFIANEPKSLPYSDSHLVKLFSQHGISLSRRTITKYREECHISNSYERSFP